MGMTAASATAGWVRSIASSSAGGTWKPLYLISSLRRSTIVKYPSGSAWPMSGVQPPGGVERGGGRLRVVQVPGHHLGTPDPQLAVLAWAEIAAARRIDDTALRIRQQRADRAGARRTRLV